MSDNTVHFMRKLCDQIDLEINSIEFNHDKYHSSEKATQALKDIFIRTISTKLPKIMNIEDKYNHQIKTLTEQLEIHKQKATENYAKYEKQLLENDNIKMETIQVSHAYQNAVKSYEEMKILLYQVKEKNRQLEHKTQKLDHTTQTSELTIIKQQLYEDTIKSNQHEIQQLKQNAKIASSRIIHLEEENQRYVFLLKQESAKNQQLTLQNIQLTDQHHQHTMSQEETTSLRQKVALLEPSLERAKEELVSKENSLQIMKIKIDETEQLAREYQQSMRECDQKCKTEQNKFQQLKKQMVELEEKYESKVKLLNKYIREQQDKNKQLKLQVNRLYEAMDQYANKEHRYTKKAELLQHDKQKYIHQLSSQKEKSTSLRGKLKQFINQFNYLKESTLELKNALLQEKAGVKRIVGEIEEKWRVQISQLLLKMKNSEEEYRQNISRCLQTQKALQKVTKNMLEYQEQTQKERREKEYRIQQQKQEIKKLKQTHNLSSEKMSLMVDKFSRQLENPDPVPRNSHPSLNIMKELELQKIRYSALQKQYENLSKLD